MAKSHQTGLELISQALDSPRSRDEMWEILVNAISLACEVDADEVQKDSPFGDLGLDSLMMMTVLAEIEYALEIEFPIEILERFDTYGEPTNVGDVFAVLVD